MEAVNKKVVDLLLDFCRIAPTSISPQPRKRKQSIMYKLDQNRPIPPHPSNHNLKPREAVYPWAQMRIGDSFFVPKGKRKSTFSTHGASKRWGAKYTARVVTEDGILGERVWRVE